MNSTPHTSHFLVLHSTHFSVTLTLAQVWCVAHFISSSCAHDVVVLILSTTLPSTLCFPSSLSSSFSFSWSSSSSSMMWGTSTLRTLANEDLGTLAENNSSTSYEPNDLHISETTDIFIQESSGDNRSLNLHDFEFDDYTIGMALSSPLFTQEREDAASHRQAYHSLDEGFVVQSVVVCRSC